MEYFVFLNGLKFGPVEAEKVRQWYNSGKLNTESLVCVRNGEWRPLSTYPEFFAQTFNNGAMGGATPRVAGMPKARVIAPASVRVVQATQATPPPPPSVNIPSRNIPKPSVRAVPPPPPEPEIVEEEPIEPEVVEEAPEPEMAEFLSCDGENVVIACPNCKSHFSVELKLYNIGQQCPCPNCKATFILPEYTIDEPEEPAEEPKNEDNETMDQATLDALTAAQAEIEDTDDIDGSIKCPHCWKGFEEEDLLYIAAHPDLIGDPLLREGDFDPQLPPKLRFKPTVYNAQNQPLDPKGVPATDRACPHCHLLIPTNLIDMPSKNISIVGAPSSGKTYFLTCMVHKLRETLPPRFMASFTDLSMILNRQLNLYESALFMSKDPDKFTQLAKTQDSGEGISNRIHIKGTEVDLPIPFCFEFRHADSSSGENLIFYDNAGERFDIGQDSWQNQATKHLSNSAGIMFIYDPTNDSNMRVSVCDENDPQVKGEFARVKDQNMLISEMISRIRRNSNMLGTDKCDIPLVMVVAKYDVWRKNFPYNLEKISPVATDESGDSVLDDDVIANISFATREFMLEHAPAAVNTAESFFNRVYFVPASNFGTLALTNEDKYGKKRVGIIPSRIKPIWVDVPMLILLSWLDGMIPHRNFCEDNATKLAAKFVGNKLRFRHPVSGEPVTLPENYAGAKIQIGDVLYSLPECEQNKPNESENIW